MLALSQLWGDILCLSWATLSFQDQSRYFQGQAVLQLVLLKHEQYQSLQYNSTKLLHYSI